MKWKKVFIFVCKLLGAHTRAHTQLYCVHTAHSVLYGHWVKAKSVLGDVWTAQYSGY